MKTFRRYRKSLGSCRGLTTGVVFFFTASLAIPSRTTAQGALETPLKQDLLTLLTNEISGQVAFNNVVKLAGAPWLRSPEEFTSTFYEAEELHNSVTEIRNRVAAMAGDEITIEQVVGYLEILEAVGWIVVDGEL